MDFDPFLVLTSSIIELEDGRAAVLLAAQPDRQRPDRYVLEATVVPERAPAQRLRLVARWQGGRRTAQVSAAGRARLRGIPATVLEAVRAGDRGALLLEIEEADE